MVYTEMPKKEELKVGDVILTQEKFMIITKIDENGIEVLEKA